MEENDQVITVITPDIIPAEKVSEISKILIGKIFPDPTFRDLCIFFRPDTHLMDVIFFAPLRVSKKKSPLKEVPQGGGLDSRIHEPYFGFHEFTNDGEIAGYAWFFHSRTTNHEFIDIHEFTNKFFNFHEFTNNIFSFHESRTIQRPTNSKGVEFENGMIFHLQLFDVRLKFIYLQLFDVRLKFIFYCYLTSD